MAITGHKIFWGLSANISETTATVHPVDAALNSPIDISLLPNFDIGNPNGITLPANFWDNSFASTGLFLRIAAYDGALLVGMSKVIPIYHYGKSFTGVGQYFPFAMPLDGGENITIKGMCAKIGSSGGFFKNAAGEWKYATLLVPGDESPLLQAMNGAIFSKPDDSGTISWIGKKWGAM